MASAHGAPSDEAGAQARFVVFLASLFQRQDLMTARDFGELLALFAATVAETDAAEGAVLARWADAVREVRFD